MEDSHRFLAMLAVQQGRVDHKINYQKGLASLLPRQFLKGMQKPQLLVEHTKEVGLCEPVASLVYKGSFGAARPTQWGPASKPDEQNANGDLSLSDQFKNKKLPRRHE